MIDPEKIPDAPRNTVDYAGVALESRYGKRRELETMMAAIDYVADRDPAVLCIIKSVFCDSKVGDCYSIQCCCSSDAEFIAALFDGAFRHLNGGHNGIGVDESKYGWGSAFIDPWWSRDGDDAAGGGAA